MAIFRKGIKIGKHDIRVSGITKERGQGILRKIGVLEDKRPKTNDGMGDMQTIRTIVAKGEGFQHPVNFKVAFSPPRGIDQQVLERTGEGPEISEDWAGGNTSKVKSGGLDWRTHIMNNSTTDILLKRFKDAQAVSGSSTKISKLDLYCSKVTIPEKQITTGLYIQSGAAPFPFPQNVTYGTLTTTFYCDGTMHIKNYFDAWQKLIHNDLTGNFNFWDEYTAEFDVFTRTTLASGARLETAGEGEKGWADKVSEGIQEFTQDLNEATGVDGPRGQGQGRGTKPIPKLRFADNYGVRIFSCFPQIVGGIDLDHSANDSIATFDVTWSYVKWNPFKMGNIGNRSTINLSVGEFRNEKDGFPFIEDLPPELSGPLSGAIGQGINTGPLSKASNLFG